MNCNSKLKEKLKISHEILSYLADHPKAQDTLEGIVNWWLLERVIKFQEAQVKKAVAELVDKGLITEKTGNDSKIHYRLNRNMLDEIKKKIILINE